MNHASVNSGSYNEQKFQFPQSSSDAFHTFGSIVILKLSNLQFITIQNRETNYMEKNRAAYCESDNRATSFEIHSNGESQGL